ncbi:hypothetical protein Ddye_009507 [Dipteronia dyeriana]|uniref:Uncharacterized protein n=1 Tax=Dipteronia dyeriana TaxID=168575 RepID=A0AAE0CMC0_9ROSI|nr:hypothetical protein Ddye_009507 [Dipteronia dyeriana]
MVFEGSLKTEEELKKRIPKGTAAWIAVRTRCMDRGTRSGQFQPRVANRDPDHSDIIFCTAIGSCKGRHRGYLGILGKDLVNVVRVVWG